MPSKKDPQATVHPNAGKLAANEVHASSLAFPIGGGSALAAHIADPVDAHMSGAIGVPEYYSPTGEPLLSTVGGPYEGESVLDALAILKDVLPPRPDRLGFNGAIVNSGLPVFTNLDNVAVKGGFTHATGPTVAYSKYLIPGGPSLSVIATGMIYPADRGVLAFYKTTGATTPNAPNFENSGQTTLLAALWLGANPAPAGIPSAAFVESTRSTGQTDYTATGTGIDKFTLEKRYPYQTSYPAGVYQPFTINFPTYQLATYITTLSFSDGDNGSYLLVHWREQYATSLAAIQPANLAGKFTSLNLYSAAPSAPEYANVLRDKVFKDSDSGTGPIITALSTSPSGASTTVTSSGVPHYSHNNISFSAFATVTGLFANTYLTTTSNGAIPVDYRSTLNPAVIDLTDFGQAAGTYDILQIKNHGTGNYYSVMSPPATSDTARFQDIVGGVVGTPACPFPAGKVRTTWRSTFGVNASQTDTTSYMYNSMGTSGSTDTLDRLTDERYRYIASAAPISTSPIMPAGGNIYNSATTRTANDGELVVAAGRIQYPSTNYQSNHWPIGPNYATVLSSDSANHIRRYIRAFDTGIARNTGKIRLRGLAAAAFASAGAYTGSEVNDHTGGAIVQIKVPGSTGWLDLGRVKGDPDLATTDFRGCAVSTVTSGSDVTVSYDTTAFTGNNGAGDYLIFVRVSFIKNGTGQNLTLDEIEWLAP